MYPFVRNGILLIITFFYIETLNRNIVIIQWVIFAIRNVCENNTQNQDIIAAMSTDGVISSETLCQMGITLHSDEQQTITMMPLNSNK